MKLTAAALLGRPGAPSCPRCHASALETCQIGDVARAVCPRCGGLWCDPGTWDHEALGLCPTLPAATEHVHVQPTSDTRPARCALGHDALVEVHVDEIEGLAIDVCRTCGGVWFDHEE